VWHQRRTQPVYLILGESGSGNQNKGTVKPDPDHQ